MPMTIQVDMDSQKIYKFQRVVLMSFEDWSRKATKYSKLALSLPWKMIKGRQQQRKLEFPAQNKSMKFLTNSKTYFKLE